MERKLQAKGFAHDEIAACLAALSAEKLQSNTRFIESYMHVRRQKGYGPLRIHAELALRGISQDMIEHHLNIADNAWFAEAHKAWQKRFKGILPIDFKIRARQMRFLHQRGFTAEHIDHIFRSDNHDA